MGVGGRARCKYEKHICAYISYHKTPESGKNEISVWAPSEFYITVSVYIIGKYNFVLIYIWSYVLVFWPLCQKLELFIFKREWNFA